MCSVLNEICERTIKIIPYIIYFFLKPVAILVPPKTEDEKRNTYDTSEEWQVVIYHYLAHLHRFGPTRYDGLYDNAIPICDSMK